MNTPWYCHQISIFVIFIQISFQGYYSFCGKVDYFFSLKKAFGIKLSTHVFINFFFHIYWLNIFLTDWNSTNHTCTNINHFWLTDYKPQHHLRMTLYWDVSKFLSSWKLLLPPAPIKVNIWTFSLKIFVPIIICYSHDNSSVLNCSTTVTFSTFSNLIQGPHDCEFWYMKCTDWETLKLHG